MGKSNKVVHDFKKCLDYSELAKDEEFWLSVYRKAFGELKMIGINRLHCEEQKRGQDRFMETVEGEFIRVDEKKRTKVYNDILLEYVSDNRMLTPGWIEKDLDIEYIAYAFMPNKTCHLIPWQPLRKAWKENKKKWFVWFEPKYADNEGYQTVSLPVILSILKECVPGIKTIRID